MDIKPEKLEAELKRLEEMSVYEKEYEKYGYVCGIDEAGRGPLAGPVVAAAVILPKDEKILFVNDSKKLSEKKREALFEEIKTKAVSYGIGIVDEKTIDEMNILQATYEAMRIAVSKLNPEPDVCLNDAVTIPDLNRLQVPIIKGDAKSVSIAAASILAKVTRDRLMKGLAEDYPEYGFEKHKGYGTKAHMDAIRQHGPSPVHRKTFLKNIETDK